MVFGTCLLTKTERDRRRQSADQKKNVFLYTWPRMIYNASIIIFNLFSRHYVTTKKVHTQRPLHTVVCATETTA